MEIVESYLNQIKKYPLLTAEEETALSKEISAGNKDAENRLVQSNLRLVVSVAKKYAVSSAVSLMDLIQEGNIGLMNAASKFNSSFETRFSTYAYPWILQYILRFVYGRTAVISLPHRKEELLRNVENARQDFIQNYFREPTAEELSQAIGTSAEDIEEVCMFNYSFTSSDVPAGEDGLSSLGDLIPDEKYNPEKKYLDGEFKKSVADLVNFLPKKEKDVIYYRYNFGCAQHIPTLRELSAKMGVSAETIRQIEIRALKRLREKVRTAAILETA